MKHLNAMLYPLVVVNQGGNNMENTGLQEDLVERVEKAAAKGAREGAKNKSVRCLFILLMVMPLVSICGLIFL